MKTILLVLGVSLTAAVVMGEGSPSQADKLRGMLQLLLKIDRVTVVQGRSSQPSVDTKMGTIVGQTVAAPQGGEVDEYLGIPFAKPPVGDLRYANPVALSELPSDPYDATDYQNACMQYSDTTFGDFPGSDMWNSKNPIKEDCLYLNVWVPKTETKNKQVVVWIFGGGFYSGSSSLWVYDGKALAAHTDMIVVSFNYRVGSLGYLSTGDGRIKGNFGMMDQVMALQWVNDNIKSFGGSTSDITLFGESAGGSSVSLHMLSKLSRNLFSRAWIQSASSDAHWAWMSQKQARERSAIFLDNLKCSDSPDLLECLRSIDADTILANDWVDSHFMVFPWAPSLDGEFMTEDPYTALRGGNIQKKDVVLGTNKNEGTFWILYAIDALSKDNDSPVTYQQFVDAVELIDWDLDVSDLMEVMIDYSPKDVNDEAANRDALNFVCGDRSFTCPTTKEADLFAKSKMDTYFYHFTHRASNEVWPEWMGVIHGSEIQFIFGMPLNKSRDYSEAEVGFSKTIMDYLANFARTGNPNKGVQVPEWPQYKNESPEHLEWRGPSQFVPVKGKVNEGGCQLWEDINQKYFNEMIVKK